MHRDQPRKERPEDRADERPAAGSFTGDSGTPAGGELARDGDTIVHPGTSPAELARPADPGQRLTGSPEERGRDIERTALDGTPGLPAGDAGETLEEVLKTPDSDLGGVTAGETTPSGETADRPSPEQVRREDRERNTL